MGGWAGPAELIDRVEHDLWVAVAADQLNSGVAVMPVRPVHLAAVFEDDWGHFAGPSADMAIYMAIGCGFLVREPDC